MASVDQRGSRGFTLLELMIALIISGILATVIFQMLAGQSRIVEQQSAREEVQQNARAAIDIISNELRGIPSATFSGSDITDDGSTIEFRSPQLWGVFCGNSSNHVVAVFPDIDPPDQVRIGFGGDTTSRRVAEFKEPSSSHRNSCISALFPDSDDAPADFGIVRRLEVAGGAVEMDQDCGTMPEAWPCPGEPVYLYERIRYSVAVPEGATMPWLHRQRIDVDDEAQPLAGPLDGPGGLFIEGPTDGAVDVRLTMKNRHEGQIISETETASTRVYLRN